MTLSSGTILRLKPRLHSSQANDCRACGQKCSHVLSHLIPSKPRNHQDSRYVHGPQEERPSHDLVQCARLEVAEWRVVYEVVDGDEAVEPEVHNQERAAEET